MTCKHIAHPYLNPVSKSLKWVTQAVGPMVCTTAGILGAYGALETVRISVGLITAPSWPEPATCGGMVLVGSFLAPFRDEPWGGVRYKSWEGDQACQIGNQCAQVTFFPDEEGCKIVFDVTLSWHFREIGWVRAAALTLPYAELSTGDASLPQLPISVSGRYWCAGSGGQSGECNIIVSQA